jgi:hypothetical protein
MVETRRAEVAAMYQKVFPGTAFRFLDDSLSGF